jgi:hypothetical protein
MQGQFSTFPHDPLWRALDAMRIEPGGAAITFAAKLARENGWDPAYAQGVASEYRRFLYLAATGDAPATPSEAVDRAWHLHLTYSRHYWDELCGRILGRPLHHDPSLGGAAEDQRHHEQYAATLERYRATFGGELPADIWPDLREREARPSRSALPGLGAAAGASLLLAACTALAGNGGGDPTGWLFAGVAGIVALVLIGSFLARAGRKGKDGREGGNCGGNSCGSTLNDGDSGSSDGGSSCGGGGCGGD